MPIPEPPLAGKANAFAFYRVHTGGGEMISAMPTDYPPVNLRCN